MKPPSLMISLMLYRRTRPVNAHILQDREETRCYNNKDKKGDRSWKKALRRSRTWRRTSDWGLLFPGHHSVFSQSFSRIPRNRLYRTGTAPSFLQKQRLHCRQRRDSSLLTRRQPRLHTRAGRRAGLPQLSYSEENHAPLYSKNYRNNILSPFFRKCIIR